MCVIAVAISTALLVSLLSVAEGIWQNASYSILSGREDILITPKLPEGAGGIWGISNGHKLANDIKADTTNVSEVLPLHTGFLKITEVKNNNGLPTDNSGTEPRSGNVISVGVVPEQFRHFFIDDNTYNFGIIELKFNNWFKVPGDPHYENNFNGPWTNEVLIDEHLSKEFDLKEGSLMNLSIANEPVTFEVAGIFQTNLKDEYFDDSFRIKGIVILHLSELQTLTGEDVIVRDNQTIVIDNIKSIAISLNPSRPEENSAKDVANDLQEKYPLLEVLTKEEQLKSLEQQNAITRVFYTAISIVAIIISLLFVACIMLITVYERTNEIGMLRAIGISKFTIFKWVLLESLFLILIGILIGFLPGYFGSELLGMEISNTIGIDQDLTAFSPSLIASSFLGMVFLGTIISLIPALRASQMRITEAVSFVR
jgi:ABC-type antimicrobial peptide transport system permease subunit